MICPKFIASAVTLSHQVTSNTGSETTSHNEPHTIDSELEPTES